MKNRAAVLGGSQPWQYTERQLWKVGILILRHLTIRADGNAVSFKPNRHVFSFLCCRFKLPILHRADSEIIKADDERLRSRTSVTDPSGATTKETRTLRVLLTSAGGAGRGEAVAQLHRLPRGKSGSPASMFDLPLNIWRRQRSNGQRFFALSQQEVRPDGRSGCLAVKNERDRSKSLPGHLSELY